MSTPLSSALPAKLTPAQEVLAGQRCQYCDELTEYVESAEVYGKSYGIMMYLCRSCWAYVGTHKDTGLALGTVAAADLRNLRKAAHAMFDSLWKRSRKNKSRFLAYKWLSEALDIPFELTHIGMFDEQTCQQVIELCRPFHDAYTEQVRQSRGQFTSTPSSENLPGEFNFPPNHED